MPVVVVCDDCAAVGPAIPSVAAARWLTDNSVVCPRCARDRGASVPQAPLPQEAPPPRPPMGGGLIPLNANAEAMLGRAPVAAQRARVGSMISTLDDVDIASLFEQDTENSD